MWLVQGTATGLAGIARELLACAGFQAMLLYVHLVPENQMHAGLESRFFKYCENRLAC